MVNSVTPLQNLPPRFSTYYYAISSQFILILLLLIFIPLNNVFKPLSLFCRLNLPLYETQCPLLTLQQCLDFGIAEVSARTLYSRTTLDHLCFCLSAESTQWKSTHSNCILTLSEGVFINTSEVVSQCRHVRVSISWQWASFPYFATVLKLGCQDPGMILY